MKPETTQAIENLFADILEHPSNTDKVMEVTSPKICLEDIQGRVNPIFDIVIALSMLQGRRVEKVRWVNAPDIDNPGIKIGHFAIQLAPQNHVTELIDTKRGNGFVCTCDLTPPHLCPQHMDAPR